MSETEPPVVLKPQRRPRITHTHPLRTWRLQHEMTQAQLAEMAKVSEATISRIEDRGFATAEVMWAIVEATNGNVTPEMILAECPFCRRPMPGTAEGRSAA